MIRFLLRRVAFAALIVFAASSTALLLARLAPGSVSAAVGPFATAEEVEDARRRLGLDRPVREQWAAWLGRAARLDFGDSYLYNRPVGPLVARAALNSVVLGVTALFLAVVAGVGLGIVSGSGRGPLSTGTPRWRSFGAALVRAVSLVGVSMPPLITSLLLVFLATRTGMLPAGGMSSAGALDLGWAAWLADVAWHLPLPAIALAVPIAATFEQLQAQSIADALRQPFVLAAVGRGASTRDAILRHAWPASLRPICAVFGLAVGALLSGSFVVEYVTAWPGLGRLMYDALRARDVYLVAGCAAMGSLFLAAGTLTGDLLLAAVDPRVREAGVS